MNIEDIVKNSPNVPLYGGGQWAMFSVSCCWWTSFPVDLGKHSSGLPCCPHCKSMLMQAPLAEFVQDAMENSEHYGPGGLDTLVAAHSRNATTCHATWEGYRLPSAPSISSYEAAISTFLGDLAESLYHWNRCVVDDDRGPDNKAICLILWDDGTGRFGTINGYGDINMNTECSFACTDDLLTYLMRNYIRP